MLSHYEQVATCKEKENKSGDQLRCDEAVSIHKTSACSMYCIYLINAITKQLNTTEDTKKHFQITSCYVEDISKLIAFKIDTREISCV